MSEVTVAELQERIDEIEVLAKSINGKCHVLAGSIAVQLDAHKILELCSPEPTIRDKMHTALFDIADKEWSDSGSVTDLHKKHIRDNVIDAIMAIVDAKPESDELVAPEFPVWDSQKPGAKPPIRETVTRIVEQSIAGCLGDDIFQDDRIRLENDLTDRMTEFVDGVMNNG